MIYDVFNFFNELELLEIRLNELDDFVDRFVLVEGTKTFQNKPKELVYEQNKHLFEKWHHKITHVVIDDSPDTNDTWAIEVHQFNNGGRGMPDLKDDDIIMWCCTDEIPKKQTIAEWVKKPLPGPGMMMQYQCGGYMNCWHKANGWWTGSRLVNGRMWKESKNQYDDFRRHWLGIHVPDAGWHFCNLGGPDRYKLKLQSFAHAEFNTPSMTADDNLAFKYKCCYDLYDPVSGHRMELMPWDMMPPYIYENREKFAHLLIPNG